MPEPTAIVVGAKKPSVRLYINKTRLRKSKFHGRVLGNSSYFCNVKKALHILKKILLNRYFLAITAFVVWMVFFDTNSLKRQRLLNARISEITDMTAFYSAEIEKNNKAIEELKTSPEAIEKYGREKYLMKRDSEDVYIITRE
jgi:cell division protein FtsB